MPRLIDADKLIELCNIMADKCDGIGKSIWEQFATTVEWSPTVDAVPLEDYKSMEQTVNKLTKAIADAEPVRHGHWKWMGETGDSRYMCSVCKSKEDVPTCNGEPTVWEYCPNCGAKMDEVREHDVQKCIDKLPTVDAEPVVRCKDCRWQNTSGCWIKYRKLLDDYDFCSEGIRREDADKR